MKLLIAIAFLAVANGMPETVRLPEPARPQFEDSPPVKEAVRIVDFADAPIETVNVVNAFEGIPEETVKNFPEVNPGAVYVVDLVEEGSVDKVNALPEKLRDVLLEILRDALPETQQDDLPEIQPDLLPENLRDALPAILQNAIPEKLRQVFNQVKYNRPFLRGAPQMEDVLPVKETVKVVDAPEISNAPIESVNVVNAFEGIPEEAVKNLPKVNPEAVRVVDFEVGNSMDKVKIVETPLGMIKIAPSELESIRVVLPEMNVDNLAR